jgi:hypothetical protein
LASLTVFSSAATSFLFQVHFGVPQVSDWVAYPTSYRDDAATHERELKNLQLRAAAFRLASLTVFPLAARDFNLFQVHILFPRLSDWVCYTDDYRDDAASA